MRLLPFADLDEEQHAAECTARRLELRAERLRLARHPGELQDLGPVARAPCLPRHAHVDSSHVSSQPGLMTSAICLLKASTIGWMKHHTAVEREGGVV